MFCSKLNLLLHAIKTGCMHVVLGVAMFLLELDTFYLFIYSYFHAVRQDPVLGASEMFNSFLRKAQQVLTVMLCCNV